MSPEGRECDKSRKERKKEKTEKGNSDRNKVPRFVDGNI